ncbi:MAG: hypothetical protein HRU10_09340 [Opitutales bacterium]|nr:hypothetical protein [Opitutales bacterium]
MFAAQGAKKKGGGFFEVSDFLTRGQAPQVKKEKPSAKRIQNIFLAWAAADKARKEKSLNESQ